VEEIQNCYIATPLLMEGIKETIFKFLRLDNLMENLSGYVEARIELLKIEIKEDVAKVLARTVMILIVAFLALLFILFLSIGLAQYLNSLFGKEHVGYWMVAGIYGVPCLIFVLFRKSISHSMEVHLMKMIKKQKK
jgi:uncharacterized membrane protein YqjE